MSLKDSWKSVGQDFKNLGKGLGSTLVKTVQKGTDNVVEWADDEDAERTERAKAEREREATIEAEAVYRFCPYCGTRYDVNRGACPNCKK